MSRWNVSNLRLQGKAPLAAAAAVLIALGAGGGAAAVSMTRPTVTMASGPDSIARVNFLPSASRSAFSSDMTE